MNPAHIAWLMLAWLTTTAMSLGRFVPAPDGPLPFRRDLLPLDAATMTRLSQRLASMARVQPMDSPAERRDTARLLALAAALDPLNDAARELAAAYRKNRRPGEQPPTPPEPAEIKPLWHTIAWLESPEAGPHGQALGALLLDLATLADPDHPRAREHHGESAGWDGWIPPLAAYQAPSRPAVRERVVPEEKTDPPDESDAPPLAEATVRTVIWRESDPADAATRKPAVASLQMRASLVSDDSENPTPLRIGPRRAEEDGIDRMNRNISRLLAARAESVPENLRVRITCPEYEQALAADTPQPVSAAAAVLACAAVTGNEPDALILAEVDSSGRLSLPPDFWKILIALGPDDGRRLILPIAAMDWLPSLLAMEKAEFFLDHEVLVARDFDELVALSAKQPTAEISAAAELFADIRMRGLDENVRDYLANRFVRQRLDELSQQAPWHASANMLHTQSAGRRPVTVHRAVIAAELRMAIQPMATIAAIAKREFEEQALTAAETASIGGIHGKCREKIDRLEKLTARTDQDLFQSARALAASLRAFERTTRTRGEYEEVQLLIHRELRGFARQYHGLEKNLHEQEAANPAD